jgi:uncharacterized protein YecE (DUF72 family)
MNAVLSPKETNKIYSGTSGLVVPESNKQSFPPAFREKSRLVYYASLFNSIEINSSFKKLPMPRTVEKWAADVPNGFQFTFKCWRGITHNKELEFNPEDIHNFIRVINHIGKKKGCILIQFPGKLAVGHIKSLQKLLESVRTYDAKNLWKVALEFRNPSWYARNVFDLLDQFKAGLVLHDLPLSAPPLIATAASFVYIRFHGTEKGYRGSYADDFLISYAKRIKAWKEEGKEVYIYFNNTLGAAAQNLMTLNKLLKV